MRNAKPVRNKALIGVAVAVALMTFGVAPSQADSERVEESTAQLTAEQKERVREKHKNRRVCRRIVVTGSRITRRVCRKQSQWDDLERQARDIHESLEQESVGYAPGSHVR